MEEPSPKLIVNYLPGNLSQNEFDKMFAAIGEVRSCKLVKNHSTGESMGYGFVEYASTHQAEMAINQLNGVRMEQKTLKVSFARKSPPESKDTNVYIANLPESLSDDQLRDMFDQYGEIINCKVLMNEGTGKSRGIGLVKYAYKYQAEKAISAMSGKRLADSRDSLIVKLAIPSVSKHQPFGQAGGVHVSNASSGMGGAGAGRYNPIASTGIPSMTPIQHHHQMDSQYGSPTTMTVAATPLTAQSVSKGSGHSTVITGQVFSLYVHGLGPQADELTLYELFSPFGGILNVKPIRDLEREGKPCKGFGFVNFRKYEDACHAATAMCDFMYEGRILHVSFKQNKDGGPMCGGPPIGGGCGAPSQMHSGGRGLPQHGGHHLNDDFYNQTYSGY